jgi:hypothetical protein
LVGQKMPCRVAVEGMRDTDFVADLAEQAEVSAGVLGHFKAGPWDPAGGIVDDAKEGEPRSAVLEPLVIAGVDLQEHALLGIALTPRAVLAAPLLGPRAAYPS